MTIEQSVLKVLKYFSIFGYKPTLDEIYTFLQKKIDKTKLKIELKRLKYTPPQYSIPTSPRLRGASNGTINQFNNLLNKRLISQSKLNSFRFKLYVKLLSLFPQIKLIGLSGSISMMNAKEDDDIDLFIITAKNRLFTGRFISLLLAQLIGIRRNRFTYSRRPSQLGNKNKVCLNLFFDESNLKVPKFKQTLFVGHEVLQMKPVIVKGDIYERFLEANRWVQNIFPNSNWTISKIKNQRSKTTSKLITLIFKLGFDIYTLIFDLFEKIFKDFQLISINRHRTTEIITSSQLWFHPDDFEKKLKIKSRSVT